MMCEMSNDTLWAIVFVMVMLTAILIAKYRTKKWTDKTLAVITADNVLMAFNGGFPELAPKAIMGSEAVEFMNHLKENGVEADLSPDKEEVFLRKGEMSSIVKVYY